MVPQQRFVHQQNDYMMQNKMANTNVRPNHHQNNAGNKKNSAAPTSGKNSQPPVPTLLAKPKNASLIGKKPVNMSKN